MIRARRNGASRLAGKLDYSAFTAFGRAAASAQAGWAEAWAAPVEANGRLLSTGANVGQNGRFGKGSFPGKRLLPTEPPLELLATSCQLDG